VNCTRVGAIVPLLVISAYAKPHYISPKQHEFASILKFTEEVFGLGSLGTTDARADDLSDCSIFQEARASSCRLRHLAAPNTSCVSRYPRSPPTTTESAYATS
jgi:Phosphoesterase family